MSKDPFYTTMGKRIAKLRKRAGQTQESLAERTSVGTSYIARIEAGSRKPTLDVLRSIAEALEVPLWRLIADERRTEEEDRLFEGRSELDAALHGLGVEDVELLLQLAVHLGRVRGAD